MRWLINYFRECFCKHDWHIEELQANLRNFLGDKASGTRVYMRCNKCGYHKSHWKEV